MLVAASAALSVPVVVPCWLPGALFEASETRMGLPETAFRSVGKATLGSRFPTGKTESRGWGRGPLQAVLCGPEVGATASECSVPLSFQCSPPQSLWSRECFSLAPASYVVPWSLVYGRCWLIFLCARGQGGGDSMYVTTLPMSLWRGYCCRSSWGTGG